MAESFFRVLKALEDEIIVDGSHVVDDRQVVFSDFTKAMLRELIGFVESGVNIRSRLGKLICENFRYTNKEILSLWRSKGHTVDDVSSIRAYVSRLSTQFYSIFGKDIYYIFQSQDSKRLKEISSLIHIFDSDDSRFDDIFIPLVSASVKKGRADRTYTLKECKQEIEVLKRLSRRNVNEMLDEVDADKLTYLKQVFNSSVVCAMDVNKDKFDLLTEFGLIDGEVVKVVDTRLLKDMIQAYAERPVDNKEIRVGAEKALSYIIRSLSVEGLQELLNNFTVIEVKTAISQHKDMF